MDLTSMISGSAQDFKLVVDYLPCYLPQFSRFYNVMAGVSLGGHTAWRIASLAAPGQFQAYTMIVGCPNLTPLLLSRLGIDTEDTLTYDDLELIMTPEQQRRWPRALAEMIYRDDCKVTDQFPTNVPLLLCNGVHDKLVPAKYTAAWIEERRRKEVPGSEQDVTFYVQENTGHSCTKEMISMLAGWLGDILNPHTPRSAL
jgi:surfactin synthase thioesterase subunit